MYIGSCGVGCGPRSAIGGFGALGATRSDFFYTGDPSPKPAGRPPEGMVYFFDRTLPTAGAWIPIPALDFPVRQAASDATLSAMLKAGAQQKEAVATAVPAAVDYIRQAVAAGKSLDAALADVKLPKWTRLKTSLDPFHKAVYERLLKAGINPASVQLAQQKQAEAGGQTPATDDQWVYEEPMSLGKKVAIGLGIAGVIGGIGWAMSRKKAA